MVIRVTGWRNVVFANLASFPLLGRDFESVSRFRHPNPRVWTEPATMANSGFDSTISKINLWILFRPAASINFHKTRSS